jgi:hypothetical protein
MYLSGPQTQANFERASRVNLLRQPIDAVDVARCALFIAENPSLNGTTLQADNGQHLVALDRRCSPWMPPSLARGALPQGGGRLGAARRRPGP